MGTLEPRKNVGTLLQAYGRLLEAVPDAPELWLAGAATEDASEWLGAIEQPPLRGKVKHLGYIQSDRRYDLYSQASMLVLPSHLEGFGIPVLEAMTVGVPVIVSNRGALPEVAGGAGQVVDAEDAEGFAAAMRRYLSEPGAASEAIDRGFARARAYSWDASASTLLDLYQRLAAGRPQ
jgi:alpha-1,3-rhamnosyl/mannosyltransferase